MKTRLKALERLNKGKLLKNFKIKAGIKSAMTEK